MRLRHALTCLAPLALAAAGCGGPSDGLAREPISGKVAVDGQPLANGLITFSPIDAPEPVVSGVIEGGSYTLRRSDGPIPGRHRVSIWAKAPTGKKVKDPDDPEKLVDEMKDVVPGRYNLKSELSAEVQPGGTNSFDFDLNSKVAQGDRPGRR
jgi:hypothetical protein